MKRCLLFVASRLIVGLCRADFCVIVVARDKEYEAEQCIRRGIQGGEVASCINHLAGTLDMLKGGTR